MPSSRLALLSLVALASAGVAGPPPPAAEAAASGYVDDRVCAGCHPKLAASFQEVGMGRAFARAREAPPIEDLSRSYFHAASARHYRMLRSDDGGLVLRRWQETADGRTVNVYEQEVDWVLGSGNHSRTYLFRQPSGELFQLPLAWYSQEGGHWGMAPGFDSAGHSGPLRPVRRECLFCHDAYPELASPDADLPWEPHLFPAELPSGIGCQRCHGPGAEHARRADEGRLAEGLAIVDPTELAPDRRRDVCYQCHLQPSVAVHGLHRFGRGDFDFRPGDAVAGDLVHVVVEQEGVAPADRFEINHHPFRLEQSPCFEKSGGALSCLTCHDPHRKVPISERPAHYRRACLGCHSVDACGLGAMTAGSDLPRVDPQDCVACHMASRRPRDVVQVTMTDHLIRRRPGGPELVAPLEEEEPVLVDLRLLDPETAPAGPLGELYRVGAYVRATLGVDAGAVDHLARVLAATAPPEPEPYLLLAKGLLAQRRFADALAAVGAARSRRTDVDVDPLLAAALEGLPGRQDEAQEAIERWIARRPADPQPRYYLGRLLVRDGRPEAGVAELEKAVALRPVFSAAWHHLGRARLALGQTAGAIAAFRRGLAIEPTVAASYQDLASALERAGRHDEAALVRRDGLAFGRPPRAEDDGPGSSP